MNAKIRKKTLVGQQMYGLVQGGSFNYFTPPVPDTTDPIISNIVATVTGTTTATITWDTDEPATSRVDYGLTSGYGSNVSNGSLVTSHSINLTGLTDGTLYHYKVTSVDGSGNDAESTDLTFTTDTATITGKSIQADAAGDFATRTAGGFPNNSPVTICFLARRDAVVDAGGTFWSFGGPTNSPEQYLTFYNANSDGHTFFWEQFGGAISTGLDMVEDEWYFIAIVIAGTGANQTTFYRRILSTPTLTSSTHTFNNADAYTKEQIHQNPYNLATVNRGSISSLKIWQAALSEAELLLESQHYTPQRTSNLFASYPMDDDATVNSALTDTSGNGRNYTAAGTLTLTSDGPVLLP
jgi:hypothetical protein